MIQVTHVSSRGELKKFINFPKSLYRSDPLWAPPLWMDERKAYSGKTSAILRNSDYTLFLARDDSGRIVGRNLAYIDHAFNEYYRERIGFFGAFEAVTDDSGAAADALLEAAESWLRERGMRAVRGPIHPVAENWGFQIEGGGVPPIFMSSYNPPEYIGFLNGRGYGKAKDLLVYQGDCAGDYIIPERFLEFSERILSDKPNLRVRPLRRKSLLEDGEYIWRISNTALADNWGYVPVDRGVFLEMVGKLKTIIDPDAIWFVEDNGVPVGYCLGFPDLNVILRKIKGRLFPFGFITLLAELPRVVNYRLFGLAVLPEYHGMGLDVLLYVHLYRAVKERGIRMEANYILEDNLKIRNALEKLALKLVKTYRVFEKGLI